MKNKVRIIVSIILIIGSTAWIMENVIFIMPISNDTKKVYGIIDGTLGMEHFNVLDSNRTWKTKSKMGHGDAVLKFMGNVAPEISFYYYDAETEYGILSENIIDGLQWMLENDVDAVSISLSSKYYSAELEDWIAQNSNKIQIYASYSNEANTFDYPARYDNVIGVGTVDTPETGNKDVIYKTNNLVIMDSKIKFYKGNSYLVPYTMIQQNN